MTVKSTDLSGISFISSKQSPCHNVVLLCNLSPLSFFTTARPRPCLRSRNAMDNTRLSATKKSHKETDHPQTAGFYLFDSRIRHRPFTNGRHQQLDAQEMRRVVVQSCGVEPHSLLAALHIFLAIFSLRLSHHGKGV